MTPRLSTRWNLLRLVPALFLLGVCTRCDSTPPNVECLDAAIQLEAGTCVEIQNQCGDRMWRQLDGFRLCDAPEGLFVQTQRDPRRRFICADQNAPAQDRTLVEYEYSAVSINGRGRLTVTVTRTEFAVVASATPTSIPVGGTSQLNVSVSGGAPPYTFAWTPAATLNDSALQNPVASPTTTTEYGVAVADANGLIATARVTVHVGLDVEVSAVPSTIDAGQSAGLNTIVRGGTPPYSFSWSPAASLDNPTGAAPSASPTATTQYTVLVTDAIGNQAADSATVTVRASTLTACFTANQPGRLAVQLDASCSSGPIVEYRWWSNFIPGAPPARTTTVPQTVFPYEIPGQVTLRLEVVDAAGNTAAVSQVFAVQ
jgi:SprB repeat